MDEYADKDEFELKQSIKIVTSMLAKTEGKENKKWEERKRRKW